MPHNTPRSINSQFDFAFSQSVKMGTSKHTDKRNPDYNKEGSLYSLHRTEGMRDTANAFAKYLNANCPNIKFVYQIRPEHAQAFLDARAMRGSGWSVATGQEMASRMNKLADICREAFSLKRDFSEGIHLVYKHDRTIRNKAMSQEDFALLRGSFRSRDSRSAGRVGIEVAYRNGLRVDEAACLRPEDIDVDAATLYISPEGAKGGKARTLDIQSEDMAFYRQLRDDTEGKDYCLGVKPGSIDRSIREEMKPIPIVRKGVSIRMADYYERTTLHAIRKLWARKRYFGLLKEGGIKPDMLANSPGCRAVWNTVKAELGHGKDMRPALFKAYIGDPFDTTI